MNLIKKLCLHSIEEMLIFFFEKPMGMPRFMGHPTRALKWLVHEQVDHVSGGLFNTQKE